MQEENKGKMASVSYEYSPLAISLYEDVAKEALDWDNIVPVCIKIAAALEAVRNVNGAFRLQVLQEVLLIALNKSELIGDQKRKLFLSIYQTVPLIAQAVISASKNPIVRMIQDEAAEVVKSGCCARWRR